MSELDALHRPWIELGPLAVSGSVVTTWVLMAVLTLLCWSATRFLRQRPGRVQVVLEGVVEAIEAGIVQALPDHARQVLPFVATLWIFLATSNLLGLLPGVHSPTADLSVTAALAVLVFVSVYWFGIRAVGLRVFLSHYVAPSPILLPFHLIGEVTRTLALAVRLFGNIMSMEMAALILLSVAGFLAPVPILMLHIVEGLVQAYIFGTLALVYLAGGIVTQRTRTLGRSE
ncbi:MAG: F0F1 ATP synthase subunit A [Candidatus Lambdaproteobacteria bacterium]|nr:F0F1 ATP synthase subunit A [Candidatus Lambdaproteobacteria bacterium]